MTEPDEAERHRAKMAKRKAVQDAEVAGKTQEKGLLMVHTGSTGERDALERFGDLVTWHSMGEGFTWETQDKARDIAACRRAWDRTKELLAEPDLALLVLDELNIALRYDYLPLDEVLRDLAGRRADLHVVVTGRNAKPGLIEAADLVTEMTLTKHHFKAGVKAQPGIEF